MSMISRSSLDEEQKKNTIFPLDDAGRTTWSNLPIIMVRPGGVLPLASNWVTESLTFNATATSHELSFGLLNVDSSYLSIDGISLTTAGPPVPPVAAVPVPALSQWALIMLSMLLGLMVLANRKRLF